MRTPTLLVSLAGLVAALAVYMTMPGSSTEAPPPTVSAKASAQPAPTDASPRPSSTDNAPLADSAKRSGEERKRMREKIVKALQEREAAAHRGARLDDPEGGDDGGRDGRGDRRGAETPDEETSPPPGDLNDRSGNHGYLLKVMNEELMPLADECYALARDANPDIEGLLVLDIDIIGDEEIGGVIEEVRPGEANELVDPMLLECMRESLFATTLPQPEESGRDAISLSMPLGPEGEP